MKTKYIKVNTADRLPEKDGEYYTEQGLLSFSKVSFWQYEGRAFVKSNNGVDNWLEPVPDREEEMREMLEEITDAIEFESIIIQNNIDNDGWEDFGGRFYAKAKKLLSELQNKP